ncbi:variable large family protein [Borrelia turicatae]|uniref:variable large family protein n=1 Tax=Borrelia turicatae TaxID=142 RepID=UPI003D7E0EBD
MLVLIKRLKMAILQENLLLGMVKWVNYLLLLLLDDANNAKKVVADVAKVVGSVTGADILQAMVKNAAAAVKLATTQNSGAAPKDATIAGDIALRAMAKGGKFATDADAKKAVEDAVVSSVTKALDTLTIAIRKTIDVGLKTVKESMKFNSIDTPVTTDEQVPETKS